MPLVGRAPRQSAVSLVYLSHLQKLKQILKLKLELKLKLRYANI